MNHPLRYRGNDPAVYETALVKLFRKYPPASWFLDHDLRTGTDEWSRGINPLMAARREEYPGEGQADR
jgi:hypothetical protein